MVLTQFVHQDNLDISLKECDYKRNEAEKATSDISFK